VVQALAENWIQGLRTFLWSNIAQFYFTALSWDSQRAIIERIFRSIVEIDDVKFRQTYISSILEETITKRPYAKHLTILLLQGSLNKYVDGSKLAIECLKNLTSEDFMQLYYLQGDSMEEYERLYPNVQGNNLENELAKIMLRYSNEGKPSNFGQRKQVTFE
jgi:secreted Zn-dependent insulinase-like peptidase